MREWTESEMSFPSVGFLSSMDTHWSSDQLQFYDMFVDPLSSPVQDPDLQLSLYSQQQQPGAANMALHLYDSPSSSTSSPSSSSSSSHPCHPLYHYSPPCLQTTCDSGSEPHCGGMGAEGSTLIRITPVGSGGRSRSQDELCVVCGDKASGYHYNALTCEGCKGFFRRSVTKKAVYQCKSGGSCEMDMYMRRKCQDCRLRKCRAVGMLAECLLTEVQCQSKRLRKGGKSKGLQEENVTSRRVSSTRRLQGQVMSSSLTSEQKYIVDRMVEAHRLFRSQDTCLSRLYEWACPEDGVALTDVVSPPLHRLLQFTRTVPGFDLLDVTDQCSLLSISSLDAMFLLLAQQFSHNPTSSSPALQLFAMESKAHLQDRTWRGSGGGGDLLGAVLSFFHSMAALRATEAEYALLTATVVLCSDQVPLHVAGCVEKMQELILDLLSRVCGPQGGAAQGGPQRFGRLLGRLTELRTLRHNYLHLSRQQPGL